MWREKVLELMNLQKINQKELSRLSGISEASISRYLKEEKTPRIDILLNISRALNVGINYLLGDDTDHSSYDEIASSIARNGNNLSDKEKNDLISLILMVGNGKN